MDHSQGYSNNPVSDSLLYGSGLTGIGYLERCTFHTQLNHVPESPTNQATYRYTVCSQGFLGVDSGSSTQNETPVTEAGPDTGASGGPTYVCNYTGCGRAFKRKGDLTRHTKTHTQLPAHHCHMPLCPRSVFGNGFHRKDKLVAHLEACHKLEHNQARYLASI